MKEKASGLLCVSFHELPGTCGRRGVKRNKSGRLPLEGPAVRRLEMEEVGCHWTNQS